MALVESDGCGGCHHWWVVGEFGEFGQDGQDAFDRSHHRRLGTTERRQSQQGQPRLHSADVVAAQLPVMDQVHRRSTMNGINCFDVGAMCGFGREHAISQGVELASDTANLADVEHCLEPYEHGGATNMNTWGLPAERVDGFTRGVLLVACGSTPATADSRDLRASWERTGREGSSAFSARSWCSWRSAPRRSRFPSSVSVAHLVEHCEPARCPPRPHHRHHHDPPRPRPTRSTPAPAVSPPDDTAHARRSGTNEASTRQVPILPPSSLRITTVAGRGRAAPGPSGQVLTAVGFDVLGADGVFQNVVDSPGCCTLTNIVR